MDYIAEIINLLETIVDDINEDWTMRSMMGDGSYRSHHSIEPEVIDIARDLLEKLKNV